MPDIPVTWRDSQTVNTATSNSQFDPDIIQLANGNILVSWTTNDAGGLGSPVGTETFAQIFDPLGNRIGGEIRLNNASTGGDEQNAGLAALPGGGFIVVYHALDNPFDGDASNIQLEEFDANGIEVSESALVITDTAQPNDPDYLNPRVAASSDTSVLIVYEEMTAGVSKIRGKIYDPATDTYGNQISLIAFTGSNTDPDVVALTNGNYVITATETNGGDSRIGYRIVNSTGSNVLGVTNVTGTESNAQNDSEGSVAALAGGGFVIAWTNTDADDTDILYRVYSSTGIQIGSGSAGDTSTTNFNNQPAVTALADGSFVIVYDNDQLLQTNVAHISATGANLGDFNFGGDGTVAAVTGLADGRFAVTWEDFVTGEISMEILDTRDNPNDPGVYAPDPWVVGTIGNDTFSPAADADFAHGWDGNDVITESGGTRSYFGDNGSDTINVVSVINADLHDGGAGTDLIDWSASVEIGATFDLAAGTATQGTGSEVMVNFENLNGTGNADIIKGSIVGNVLNGNGGNDTIGGASGNDIIVGNDGVDNLFGGAGNDKLNGGAGVDQLRGAAGNDTYTVNANNEVIEFAGQGYDTVFSSNSHTLEVNVEQLILFGPAGINGMGNASNNTMTGTAAANTMHGGDGKDKIDGLGGNDNLFGDLGDDNLLGKVGNDTINGGLGRDIMSGGGGNDVFNFVTVAQSGLTSATRDQITDFNAGTLATVVDRIDLSDIDAIPGGGNNAFTFVTGAFTGVGQVRVIQQGANSIVEVNNNAATGAEMTILLVGITAATVNGGDFVL